MMRTFGTYEAVEELSRTAFGAVYSARPSGSAPKPGAPPAHFVKVFAPPALDDAGVRASTQTENFLAAARLQQKAASSSRHWAPVHEIGTSAEGAYYVSSLYPMSARRLVMGRVKLTDGDLHALVSAIVQGLKDLRASCTQAHGNIKLTTVLLPRGGESAYGQAVLAEPLLPHKAAAVTEAADLADLAKLIYHLVVHRAFSDAGGWPIPAGAEWSRLGARGEAWRELCNTLLDPAAAGDASRGLDWLSGALDGLKPRRQLVSMKMRVAAAVVVLLVGIGYALYAHYAPYFRYSAGDWTRLADAYGGWLRALDQGDPELDVAQQLDADLRAIVAELKRADVVFDTKRILGEEAKDYAYDDAGLRDLRPKTAEAQRLTRRAVEYLAVVEERLKRWKPAGLAARVGDRCKTIAPAVETELLAVLEQTSTAPPADESGRTPTAIDFANAMAKLAKLAPVLDAIDKDLTAVEEVERSLSAQRIGGAPVFRDVGARLAATYGGAASVADLSERLAEVKAAIGSINGDWSALSPALTQAYDRDDDVLKLVPEFVRLALYDEEGAAGAGDGASVAGLQRRVQKLRVRFTERPWSELQARALDWRAGQIEKEEFRKSAPYAEPAGQSPEALLAAWAANAGDFVKLPAAQDPRVALAAGVAKVEGALKELDADYPPPAPVSPEVREVKAEADAWKSALSELQKLKWLGGQRNEIERRADEGAQKLAALLVAIEAARSVPATVREEYIAGVRERGERLVHPLLRRKSQAEQQVWFKDAAVWRSDPKSLKPPAFRKVQEVVGLAEQRLTEMDVLSSRLDLEPGPRPPAWHGTLVAELEKLAEAELTKAVSAGLGFSNWSNLAGDDFEQRWPAVRDAYRAWVEDAAGLVANLTLVEALLDGGYGLQPAASEAYASATKSRQWEVAAKLVGTLVGRIEGLEKLTDDRAALLVAAKESDPSVAVAAWRRLGTPDWPGDVKELDAELALQKVIEERVKVGGTKWPAADPLLQKFRDDLEDERRARRRSAWLRLAEKVDYGQEARRQRLDEVMARMTQCDIAFPPTGSPELTPETRFNIALYRFREDLQAYRRLAQPNAAAGEESIKEQDRLATARLAGFKNDLPAELKHQKWVTDVLAKLEEQAKPIDRRQVVMADDGPRASRVKGIAWDLKSDARDEVRTYTWGAHTLRFRRLEQPPGSAGDAVFLCTSEVPLGLFRDVVDAAATEAKTDRLRFAGLSAPGFLQGPHVWDRTLRPQLTWLPNVRDDFRGKYAERFNNVDQQLKERGLEMPMQRVPPAAAMHFAHLVGCRLPTSGEFEIARGMHAVVSKATANLRDPAWAEQQAFLLDLVASAGADAEDWAPWPDFGTFDAGADIPSRAQARAAQGVGDDGYLWFRPVHSADDTFGDLTGNVAEWLWDDVKVLEEAGKDKGLATFRGIVTNHWRGKLWIAGASAMSTFTPGPDRQGVTNPAGSFADVGFRLAFTVPSRTIVDRMWLVADKQPYAVAAAAGGAAVQAGPK